MIDWNKWLPILLPTAAAGVTGFLGYKAATGAAKTQAESAAASNALLRDIYLQNRTDLAPQRQAGNISLAGIMRGLGMQVPGLTPEGEAAGTAASGGASSSPFASSLTFTGSPKGSGWFGDTARGVSLGATFGGPVGAVVGGGIGAVTNLFGRGKREANQIVPLQNALSSEIDRISDEVKRRQANGTLTQNDLGQAIGTVDRLMRDFDTFTDQFDRAGGGADETINKYYGTLTKDWDATLGSLPTSSVDPATGVPLNSNGPYGGFPTGYFSQTFTPNDLYIDPSYKFILGEGQKALENSAAARGMALSGSTLKSLQRYIKNMASTEYQNAYQRFNNDRDSLFNKLATVAGIGQVATNQGVNLAANYGSNVGANMQAGANALAAGRIGGANSINDAIMSGAGSIGEAMLLRDILNKMPGSTRAAATSPDQAIH